VVDDAGAAARPSARRAAQGAAGCAIGDAASRASGSRARREPGVTAEAAPRRGGDAGPRRFAQPSPPKSSPAATCPPTDLSQRPPLPRRPAASEQHLAAAVQEQTLTAPTARPEAGRVAAHGRPRRLVVVDVQSSRGRRPWRRQVTPGLMWRPKLTGTRPGGVWLCEGGCEWSRRHDVRRRRDPRAPVTGDVFDDRWSSPRRSRSGLPIRCCASARMLETSPRKLWSVRTASSALRDPIASGLAGRIARRLRDFRRSGRRRRSGNSVRRDRARPRRPAQGEFRERSPSSPPRPCGGRAGKPRGPHTSELSQLLELPEGTVKSWLHEAPSVG
jgi:hypothetical protein